MIPATQYFELYVREVLEMREGVNRRRRRRRLVEVLERRKVLFRQ